MPSVQLRFDVFFGDGFSFIGPQALLPPIAHVTATYQKPLFAR
jgi:hypothetical protein